MHSSVHATEPLLAPKIDPLENVFTMLVIVAVVTTVMTGPLLRVLLPRAGYVVPQGVEA